MILATEIPNQSNTQAHMHIIPDSSYMYIQFHLCVHYRHVHIASKGLRAMYRVVD